MAKYLLFPSAAIDDKIQNLIQSSVRIAPITDQDLRLIGSVSDGDIRRVLLQGLTLLISVSEVMNRYPIVVSPNTKREEVMRLISENCIH